MNRRPRRSSRGSTHPLGLPKFGLEKITKLDLIPGSGLVDGWATTGIVTADINGDGRADVIIGASDATLSPNACSKVGAVHVFLAGQAPNAPITFQAPVPGVSLTWFGWSVAAASGSRLIVVGEKGRSVGGMANAGQVYVYRLK